MKFYRSFISGILFMFFLGLSSNLFAAEILIHNGKTLTVTGKTLFANCSDTTIEGGSSIIFDSALFQDMGRRKGLGGLVFNNSTLRKCYTSFYAIPRPDGKAAIFGL